jgi:hypothetical protein
MCAPLTAFGAKSPNCKTHQDGGFLVCIPERHTKAYAREPFLYDTLHVATQLVALEYIAPSLQGDRVRGGSKVWKPKTKTRPKRPPAFLCHCSARGTARPGAH